MAKKSSKGAGGKKPRVRLHKSFRRSYREDYIRQDDQQPGLLAHASYTLGMLIGNWRTFGALLLTVVITSTIVIGILSEQTYTSFQSAIDETASGLQTGDIGRGAKAGLLLVSTFTSGGLSQTMTETQKVLTVLLFLIIWLTVIFLLRAQLAGGRPKMRDALYSALAPLVGTILVAGIVFIHLIPVFLAIFVGAAANETGFLATPFYALLFWLFSVALSLLSGYLISSSLVALIAVTVPATRPLAALNLASDLMAGRRIKFIIRVLFLGLLYLLMLIAIVYPILLFDLWLKSVAPFSAGWPVAGFTILVFTVFFFIYGSAYIYLYYRRLIDKKS